jgi:hypothetical protein
LSVTCGLGSGLVREYARECTRANSREREGEDRTEKERGRRRTENDDTGVVDLGLDEGEFFDWTGQYREQGEKVA